ncbi:hypothetical protein DFJ73DRAFT_825733 [Zopfochytrium polystomum]|nr:hypothetical protein DFJ73DRAFT_825733 [Zopfochytrium polystomum]
MSFLKDVGGLLAVAICWGLTNPFIKLGSKGVDRVNRRHATSSWITRTLAEYWFLLSKWQFTLPLAINLSGSAVYYYTLGQTNMSMVVPVTSSLTLAFTTVGGVIMGEDLGSGETILGLGLVFLGVLLCIS